MNVELTDIIAKILGDVYEFNDKSLKNLDNYEECLTFICKRLLTVAKHKNVYNTEERQCGEKAFKALSDAANYLMSIKEIKEQYEGSK